MVAFWVSHSSRRNKSTEIRQRMRHECAVAVEHSVPCGMSWQINVIVHRCTEHFIRFQRHLHSFSFGFLLVHAASPRKSMLSCERWSAIKCFKYTYVWMVYIQTGIGIRERAKVALTTAAYRQRHWFLSIYFCFILHLKPYILQKAGLWCGNDGRQHHWTVNSFGNICDMTASAYNMWTIKYKCTSLFLYVYHRIFIDASDCDIHFLFSIFFVVVVGGSG